MSFGPAKGIRLMLSVPFLFISTSEHLPGGGMPSPSCYLASHYPGAIKERGNRWRAEKWW